MSATIEQTIGELRATLVSYIEATYHIGDPTMVRQRQRLLIISSCWDIGTSGTMGHVPANVPDFSVTF
jgi:hypothetical protein